MTQKGIYEQIISITLKEELASLDPSVDGFVKGKIDEEDANKFLASYVISITRKALKHVRENERNKNEALYSTFR